MHTYTSAQTPHTHTGIYMYEHAHTQYSYYVKSRSVVFTDESIHVVNRIQTNGMNLLIPAITHNQLKSPLLLFTILNWKTLGEEQ